MDVYSTISHITYHSTLSLQQAGSGEPTLGSKYIYIYVYIYVCIYIYVCVCVYIYVGVQCVGGCMHVCLLVRLCICHLSSVIASPPGLQSQCQRTLSCTLSSCLPAHFLRVKHKGKGGRIIICFHHVQPHITISVYQYISISVYQYISI
jgi:hypothetical protein